MAFARRHDAPGRRRFQAILSCAITMSLLVIEAGQGIAGPGINPTVLLTADTEGHVDACATCPSHSGLGGLARRATLTGRLRQEGPLLLLDAGNAFFGGDSAESGGKVIRAAYEALGYDAVNISYRDFREGRESTLALVKGAKFAAVSANLLDEQTGELLFKPLVIKEVAGRKLAILGVTEAPIGLEFLPYLKEQLEGVRIRPPAEALGEWLPKARADSAQVILLYYGSAAGLEAIRDRFGKDLSSILAGGIQPDELPQLATPPLAAAEQHGRTIARIRLDAATAGGAEQLAVAPSLAADPAMSAVLDPFTKRPPTVASLPATPPQVVTTAPAPAPATQMATAARQAPATVPAPQQASTQPTAPVSEMQPTGTAQPTSRAVPGPALARVAAHQNRTPQGLAGVGLAPEQVNGAIERGRDFLWAHLQAELARENRRFGQADNGFNLLEGLALVHAGAQLKYPAFDAMIRDYLDRLDPVRDSLGTYQMGIVCMLIGDYADPKYLPKMRLLARSLVEQQLADGSWHYGRILPEAAFGDLHAGPALSVEGGTPLDDPNAAAGEAIARTLPFEKHEPGDNSTSQFAMLGLRAAARVRVRAAPQVWQRSLQAFYARRCQEGGWAYDVGSAGLPGSYGSMSCSGICSIAIARHELGEKEPAVDPAIEAGLGWLDSHFSVTSNPEHGGYLYYYLYSLERVGRILDTEFIGAHEWYPLGAQCLVGAQKSDGSWLEPLDNDPRAPTSFALLFLTRATQSLKVEIKRGGEGQIATSVATPPPARLYVILDASGSMLDDMDGRQKFDIARDAVSAILDGLPDSAEVALRVYGHRKRSLEPDSDQDTALEFPMAKIDRPKLKALLQRLRPRGKTPLALSLQQATQDLSWLSGQLVTVVLLTDGGEDTMPRRDPVKAAAQFARTPGLTFHIVGFDINQEDWGQQLRAMAVAGHGRYWPAARAKALQRQIRSAVFGIPDDFTLYDSSTREVGRGEFGQAKTVPEGKYLFKTTYGGRDFQSELWVNTGASTAVIFDASHVGAAPTEPTTAPATPPVAHRFCTHCGQLLPPAAKFCPHCGQPVSP
jgi:hypothetical protein